MKSFIDVSKTSHFPIQNLPYGIFSSKSNSTRRIGVAIGDQVLDLKACVDNGLLSNIPEAKSYLCNDTLNCFMSQGKATWTLVRQTLQNLLNSTNTSLRDDQKMQNLVFCAQNEIEMHMPCDIGDYTDFYASKEHATNVGIMFRGKDNALQPNWTHLPVGYHGRASSIVVSGTGIKRPSGQLKPKDGPPKFGICNRLDIELEMAFLIGSGNKLGVPIKIDQAEDHIFGVVMMNDWSARDIQAWEYVPLGPFLGKNFATTISPWVVTLAALNPFKTTPPKQDPTPLEYLQSDGKDNYDVKLEVLIRPRGDSGFHSVAKSNLKYMYWSFKQQLAHHTVNGCNMRPGDLCGTGTISGPSEGEYGSFLELSWSGEKKVKCGNVERTFLDDGDTINLVGYCDNGEYRVGFGDCLGTILPS